MEAQRIADDNTPFARSRARFERFVERLRSPEVGAMTHSEVEAVIQGDGREILRQLFQDHVDLRSEREQAAPRLHVVGEDGVERPHHRDTTRRLITLVGEIVVQRIAYSQRAATSRHPMDAALNLPRDPYSLGVRYVVARVVASSSFEESVSLVAEMTGTHVAKRQAEQLARDAAVDFETFYTQRSIPPLVDSASLLVLTADGKGIVVRTEDLREATRKAATARTPRLKTRLTKGEKKHAKRMAMVTAAYTVLPHKRTAEDVIRDLRRETPPEARERPRARDKRVWATIEHDAAPAISALFDEAERRDPHRRLRWVVVVDGNTDQLKLVREEAKRRGVQVTIVLDFIHVLQYLWAASTAFNGETSAEREEWVLARLADVLRGKGSDVAAGMRRSATKRAIPKPGRIAVDKCADYLLKYKQYLRYDEYLRDGLPIASGVIEGACRHLVKDRMDLTGARWSLLGAEAVLKLRALKASGHLAAYWKFHEAQEHRRNHVERYQGDVPAVTAAPTRLRLVK
jgi:hypothetical protein